MTDHRWSIMWREQFNPTRDAGETEKSGRDVVIAPTASDALFMWRENRYNVQGDWIGIPKAFMRIDYIPPKAKKKT